MAVVGGKADIAMNQGLLAPALFGQAFSLSDEPTKRLVLTGLSALWRAKKILDYRTTRLRRTQRPRPTLQRVVCQLAAGATCLLLELADQ
jgi:hypothetical protein